MRLAAGAFVATLLLLASAAPGTRSGKRERRPRRCRRRPFRTRRSSSASRSSGGSTRRLPPSARGCRRHPRSPGAERDCSQCRSARAYLLELGSSRASSSPSSVPRACSHARPIFPIGDVNPRLPVQVEVVGVIDPEGRPVAFRAVRARAAPAPRMRTAIRSRSRAWSSSPTVAARGPGRAAATSFRPTRRSGSPGFSSIRTPRSGQVARAITQKGA